jgi:hypothetical protein
MVCGLTGRVSAAPPGVRVTEYRAKILITCGYIDSDGKESIPSGQSFKKYKF